MDDLPTWANLLIVYALISIVFQFIYLLDRKSKREGLLFTQPPSKNSRIFAFLIGCLLGGAFITTWLVGIRENIEIALLALASIALFAYSFGLYRPLAKIQTAYAEIAHSFPFGKRKAYHRPSNRKRKRIIGIHQLSFKEINHKVRAGARFVVFEYCISPLFVTIDYESDIFFIEPGEDSHRPGLRYILISALFGWFSIFGPISTIHCLITDIGGGKDVTHQVVDMLKWRSEQEQLAQTQ